ncbi:hypothetical protein [Nonomuraea glycinis]|jgi:hypothetical protein|uniref:hypothetical protein n=1 Tax=Nonomuraea glycinis TaxID=2047744 RepID=UPI002E161862|nr:hypothetical protein OHA68_07460 [Nonomuraea glycinis]
MGEFMLGVVSSLLATALTVLGGWACSLHARRWPAVLLSRITGLGVLRALPRQQLAGKEMAADLARARWVRVLAGRGNELTRDSFAPVWEAAESVQVLLPDTMSGHDSWLAQRASDIRRVDPGFSPGLLADQVRVNAAYVSEIRRHGQPVSLRYYNLPNLHRLVITDDVAYLTLYRQTEHGRNSPCIVAHRPGVLYDHALFLFTTTWEHSRPAD